MSGRRAIWGPGYPVVDEDMQRGADAAAAADDLALATVMPTGTTGKAIVPLFADDVPLRLLAQASGGDEGRLYLRPCPLTVGDPTTPTTAIALSATVRANAPTPVFMSNATGDDRYDMVYATIARANTVTGARKIKNVDTGAVGTQTVPLASDVAVTLTVLEGTDTRPSDPDYGVPADGAGAYNFPLAFVIVPTGYVTGDPITDAMVQMVWTRGAVAETRSRRVLPATIMLGNWAPGINGRSQTEMGRFGGWYARGAFFQHDGASGVATVLDSGDWRRRLVRIRAIRAMDHDPGGGAAYPDPAIATILGYSKSYESMLTPTGDGDAVTPVAQLTVGSDALKFFIDPTTGAWKVLLDYAPGSGITEYWYFELEASDSFAFLGTR